MDDDEQAPEHIQLIEELTDIEFDPSATPSVPLQSAVESTLLALGQMTLRARAEGNLNLAHDLEDAIEGFGPIFNALQDETDE